MNLTIRKGTPTTFSPDITFQLVSGQYVVSASPANPSGTNSLSQVLFYWAAAAYPTTTPQLFGWSLAAYLQPIPGQANPAPGAGLMIPAGTLPQVYWDTTIWVPDANVGNIISSSFDPNHIMIIAQVIQLSPATPLPVAHPTDFNWWPGTNSYVAAAIFPWP